MQGAFSFFFYRNTYILSILLNYLTCFLIPNLYNPLQLLQKNKIKTTNKNQGPPESANVLQLQILRRLQIKLLY